VGTGTCTNGVRVVNRFSVYWVGAYTCIFGVLRVNAI